MAVCYIIFTRPHDGVASGSCLVCHDVDLAADAMHIAGNPSESFWIVPGTVDPMAD